MVSPVVASNSATSATRTRNTESTTRFLRCLRRAVRRPVSASRRSACSKAHLSVNGPVSGSLRISLISTYFYHATHPGRQSQYRASRQAGLLRGTDPRLPEEAAEELGRGDWPWVAVDRRG